MSLSSEEIEYIVSGWIKDLPEPITRINVRDIICQLLYEFGVPSNQLVLIMLLILDKYSLDNVVEEANNID
jgi:hypothetical protein